MTIREIKMNAEATIKLMEHLEELHSPDTNIEERQHVVLSAKYILKSAIVGAVVGDTIHFIGQSGVLEAV